jgi:Fibronectin type III domain
MKSIASLFTNIATAFVVAALLASCNGVGSSGTSADAPPDLKATAGDSQVTLTWTPQPDVEYWLFYAPVAGVTTSNWASLGGRAVVNVSSPYVLSGLVNGSTYSFTMNGRKKGGPGGPGAPTQVAVPRLAGSVWSAGPALGTTTLNGVAAGAITAGNSTVAVGNGGAIYSAIAGAAAVVRTNPAGAADLNAVAFGSSGYVTVGAAGTILLSTDAITFTAQTSNTTNTLYGVVSNGVAGFVAVGAGGTVLNSADGKTWTVATSGTTNDLYAITLGSGRYIAAGKNGTLITSTDTTTWTTVTLTATDDLRGAAVGTNATTSTVLFVAVGAAGTLFSSTDGTTWTKQTPISANDFAAVIYGGQFVAVGNAGSIYTSSDGTTWKSQTSGTTSDLKGSTRSSAGYTAVGATGTNLFSF